MNIEEVRRNFQKASIVVSPTKLTIVYGNWDTRYSDEVTSDLFAGLIHDSSSVRIEACDRSSVKIIFYTETGETKSIIYPHMKDELSLRELEKICIPEDTPGNLADYLPDNCVELDFSELSEYVTRYMNDQKECGRDICTNRQQWKRVLDTSLEFATSIGAEIEIVEPDPKTPGIVTVFALDEPRKYLLMEGKRKDLLEAAVRESYNVTMEIGSTEGILYLMFGTKYD